MPVSYKVDLGELQRVLDCLDAWERTLQAKVADLDRTVEQLHGTWQGEAAAAQRAAHQRLLKGAAEVRDGLAKMHAAGRNAHDNYQRAAEANVQTWSQLR